MASSLPLQPSTTTSTPSPYSTVQASFLVKKHLVSTTTTATTTTITPFLLLLLIFLLSLILLGALFLLDHPSLFSAHDPPFLLLHQYLLSPLYNLLFYNSTLLHLYQHYFSFLLSPLPIFILANFIIFTLRLLFKTFYLNSSSSSYSPYNLSTSDFASEKFEYHDDDGLPVQSGTEDFFLSSPHLHYILSPDPPPDQEYHVLSFAATDCQRMQSFNSLNNDCREQRVKLGIPVCMAGSYIDSSEVNGVVSKRQPLISVEMKAAKSNQTVLPARMSSAPCKLSSVLKAHEGRAIHMNGKACRSSTPAPKGSTAITTSQDAVIVNMEGPLSSSSRRLLSPLPTQVAHPPSNTSNMQRPPSSPKASGAMRKSSTSSTGDHGRSAAPPISLKPNSAFDKQVAAKAHQLLRRSSNLQQHIQSNNNIMVRSYSEQRLLKSSDVITTTPPHHHAVVSSSLTKYRPRGQKAQSSVAVDHITMQRTQSLRTSCCTTHITDNLGVGAEPLQLHVPRSPSFSEALDALSDADANKRFSKFIAHRFALMKKELDVHST